MVKFHIPIRLLSLLNERMDWRKMARVKKKQRRVTRLCIHNCIIPPLPLTVTITRIGPRKLDDDNLQGACKYVRDEIAAKVGVDDGSTLYTWKYEQQKGEYGVDVEITKR